MNEGPERVPGLLLGPDRVYVPEKYAVERGIVDSLMQEAIVLVFFLDGHEVRFAVAPPNAKSLASMLNKNADEAKDVFKS